MTLEALPQEILLQICHAMYEYRSPYAPDWQGEGISLPQILNALSRTNKKFRNICLPMIFNRITMQGKDKEIVERIEQMKVLSADATFHVRSLVVTQRTGFLGEEIVARESTLIATHLPTVFTRFKSLQKLQLYIYLPCMAKTVEIVKSNKIELPHINTVFMKGFCAEFLNLFPEVTTLASGFWPPPTKNTTFIHLADGGLTTTKITRLIVEKQQNYGRQADGMYKVEKLHEQLRDAPQAMPHLEYLELKDLYCYHVSDIFTQILPSFTNLKHLTFPRGYDFEDEENYWALDPATFRAAIADLIVQSKFDFSDRDGTPGKQLSFECAICFVIALGYTCRKLEDVGFGKRAWSSRNRRPELLPAAPRRRFHFIRSYDGTIMDVKWRLERWNDGERCGCEIPCNPFRGLFVTVNEGEACNSWAAMEHR